MGLWHRSARRFMTALILMAGLSACAMDRDLTADGAPLARQITAISQCGFTAPGLVYMDSSDRFEAMVRERGLNLPDIGGHDFDREHLLLVAAGRKPSGGYGVALDDVAIRDGVLEVSVEVRSPAPDQAVTMALTSPCALLAVTPSGWDQVRVSGPGFDEISYTR